MPSESVSRWPRLRVRSIVLIAGVFAATLLSCGRGDRFDAYVGDLDNDTYAGQRWRTIGLNALGEEVEFPDFEGRFLWVDYSASWCGYCSSQASIIRKLEHGLGEKVVFLTIMVDSGEPMTDPTPQTAKAWAERFGLDARKVVAQRIYVGPVPHHFLFSPTGQTLYRESGLHSEELIETKLAEHMNRWNRWKSGDRIARR